MRLHHTLIAAVIAVISLPSISRADVPAPTAYASTYPAYDWRGAYVGVSFDHRWGRNEMDMHFFGSHFHPTVQDKSWGVSGHAGYSFQYGRIVITPAVLASWTDAYQSVGARIELGYDLRMFEPYGFVGYETGTHSEDQLAFERRYSGLMAGGGLKWKLTESWIGFGEYNHTQNGIERESIPHFLTLSDTSSHTVRMGLNYRF